MKFQQFFTVLLLMSTTCFGQEKQEVNFKKIGKKKRTITLVLPTECSVLKKDGDGVNRSSLYSRNDSTLFFLEHYFDSVKINSIWQNDSLKNKEKKVLLDSLYSADTMTIAIKIQDIQLVTFHTNSAKQVRYKFRFWGLGAVFIASGGLFLVTVVDSVENRTAGDYFAIASYPTSVALWFRTAKLRLNTEKWEIL